MIGPSFKKPALAGLLAAASLSAISAAAAGASKVDAVLEPLLTTCVQCHGPDFGGRQQRMAPRLAGLGAWYLARQLRNFRDGIRGDHPQDGYGMQMNFVAGMFSSNGEIHRMAERVDAARPDTAPATVEGDIEHGRKLYASCGACHGQRGEGNETVNSPRLAGQNDWYLAGQLRNFRAGVRGSHGADTDGKAMAVASQTLTTDAGVDDVVAYINTLN